MHLAGRFALLEKALVGGCSIFSWRLSTRKIRYDDRQTDTTYNDDKIRRNMCPSKEDDSDNMEMIPGKPKKLTRGYRAFVEDPLFPSRVVSSSPNGLPSGSS